MFQWQQGAGGICADPNSSSWHYNIATICFATSIYLPIIQTFTRGNVNRGSCLLDQCEHSVLTIVSCWTCLPLLFLLNTQKELKVWYNNYGYTVSTMLMWGNLRWLYTVGLAPLLIASFGRVVCGLRWLYTVGLAPLLIAYFGRVVCGIPVTSW